MLCPRCSLYVWFKKMFNYVVDGSRYSLSLSNYSFLHYEQLKDNLSGLSSVRICNGRVERLLFVEKENGVEIRVIELNTKHYGSKK